MRAKQDQGGALRMDPQQEARVFACRAARTSRVLVPPMPGVRGWLGLVLAGWIWAACGGGARADSQFVGTWVAGDDAEITELTFRPGGRYHLDTRSPIPELEFSLSERGWYQVAGEGITLTPDEYLGEPSGRGYRFARDGEMLTLTRTDLDLVRTYRLKPGSPDDVVAREGTRVDLVRSWERRVAGVGTTVTTFRPDGHYFVVYTPTDSPFPPEVVRGRYTTEGRRLVLTPYSGVAREVEVDFYGDTLTLITREAFSGQSATSVEIPGSADEVRAKAAETERFFQAAHWPVGVWEIRSPFQTVDLTLRPDGRFLVREDTEFLRGVVRGRYSIEGRRIRFEPFPGQDLYARSNGQFGKAPHERLLDYYDGELQFIDPEALSQSVTLARKRAGSEAEVQDKVRAAGLEQSRDGWQVGTWEVHDPEGWMEFTFRPDGRYVAQAGLDGVPGRVERGRYRFRGAKVTLAPYPGLGAARGFELDLYDGDLFLAGDLRRLVVARKVPGSESEVTERTLHPSALNGERGVMLGRWSAGLPGQSTELVFRPDGEFRLTRCDAGGQTRDKGLYQFDPDRRTLVYDARTVAVQTFGLDFYGPTLTLFGGHGAPATYTVNLGQVDASIAASLEADAADAAVDAQWLPRTPIAPRDPRATYTPTGDLPADPLPARVFDGATVFTGYQLYRRLMPGWVYFNVGGVIRSVAVTHTREWHFFPHGRVLVRFRNHSAGVYPNTIESVTTRWGAYHVGPKPEERDILHRYADQRVLLSMDLGDEEELTLEEGRRLLFLGKDSQLLSAWAAEQKPVPCTLPPGGNPGLLNTPLGLATTLPPDEVGELNPVITGFTGSGGGPFTLHGTTDGPGTLVVERATRLHGPPDWEAWQTATVPGGPFAIALREGAGAAAWFRVRAQE